MLVLLASCDAPDGGTPVYEDADPGEAWVDGGGLLVPPLGALLSVSGADGEGLRVWTVSLGEDLTCARQLEHDLAVEAANQQWIQDGDHAALQEGIDAADRALYPVDTWRIRIDLGRRAEGTDPLEVEDIRLFGELRGSDAPDAEVDGQSPGVLAFDGTDTHAAGQLGFGATWVGPAVRDDYYEFVVGFDASVCE